MDNTTGTLTKNLKKERSDPDTNKVNRSLLKRSNTESSDQAEIKQEDETHGQMEEEEDNLEENFDSQHQTEENSYEELSQDQEDGHFSGSQTDDVAAG